MTDLTNTNELQQRIALYDDMKAYHAPYYLYSIAKNFCLSYITRHFKNPVTSLDDLDIEPMVTMHNPEELCISSDLALEPVGRYLSQSAVDAHTAVQDRPE